MHRLFRTRDKQTASPTSVAATHSTVTNSQIRLGDDANGSRNDGRYRKLTTAKQQVNWNSDLWGGDDAIRGEEERDDDYYHSNHHDKYSNVYKGNSNEENDVSANYGGTRSSSRMEELYRRYYTGREELVIQNDDDDDYNNSSSSLDNDILEKQRRGFGVAPAEYDEDEYVEEHEADNQQEDGGEYEFGGYNDAVVVDHTEEYDDEYVEQNDQEEYDEYSGNAPEEADLVPDGETVYEDDNIYEDPYGAKEGDVEEEVEEEGQIEEEGEAEENLEPMSFDIIETRCEVRTTENKGRCLYAKEAYEPGCVIFVELPVLVATSDILPDIYSKLNAVHQETPLSLPPIWHVAAIYCLTKLDRHKQDICFNKWVPDPTAEPSEDVLLVLAHISGLLPSPIIPVLYERMLQVWRYNSFGYHTETDGLVLYNRISMMAHSCHATACWHYGANDAFVLRSRIKLNKGDEITISYIGDDDLFKSTNIRREKLSGWLFTCSCNRCSRCTDPARGFRCSVCGAGSVSFLSEPNSNESTSTPCTVCSTVPSQETIQEYLEFEQAYADRLDETDKNDMEDAQLVFEQATRVFSYHWILYALHTILFEGYRDNFIYEAAKLHQMERINFATQVVPHSTYTLAWLHEEMGDILCFEIDSDIINSDEELQIEIKTHQKLLIQRYYENASNLLLILCGASHEYSLTALRKLNRIQEFTSTP